LTSREALARRGWLAWAVESDLDLKLVADAVAAGRLTYEAPLPVVVEELTPTAVQPVGAA